MSFVFFFFFIRRDVFALKRQEKRRGGGTRHSYQTISTGMPALRACHTQDCHLVLQEQIIL